MIDAGIAHASSVWIVVVHLLHGQPQTSPPIQLVSTEELCRGMAANLVPGSRIIGMVDGKLKPVRFMACWRAQDGYLVEEIKPRWRP